MDVKHRKEIICVMNAYPAESNQTLESSDILTA